MSGAFNGYGDPDFNYSTTDDGFGTEFDYFDENPDEDPFMPKSTCHACNGSGFVLNSGGESYCCPNCYGTGVER